MFSMDINAIVVPMQQKPEEISTTTKGRKMSADNFVGVRENKNGSYSIFEYGCMSILDEDCQYLKDASSELQENDRATALVTAHDIVNRMDICEYGVVEVTPKEIPCGHCYVCVHIRGIAADTVVRCTKCREPISTSEWQTHTNSGIYHNRCEPR
jgi:hypothetical protein